MTTIESGRHAAVLQLIADRLRESGQADGNEDLVQYSSAIESVAAAMICGETGRAFAPHELP